MALGAQASDIRTLFLAHGVRLFLAHGVRLFLAHGVRLVAAGVALGLAAATVLTRTMSSLFFGVTASDVSTYAAVAVVLGAITLVATWLPARRAARLDPLVALRRDT